VLMEPNLTVEFYSR